MESSKAQSGNSVNNGISNSQMLQAKPASPHNNSKSNGYYSSLDNSKSIQLHTIFQNGNDIKNNIYPQKIGFSYPTQIKKDIILKDETTNITYNIPGTFININSLGQINLNEIIESLKLQGFQLQNKMIFCQDPRNSYFTYLGNDPLPENKLFSAEIFINQDKIFFQYSSVQKIKKQNLDEGNGLNKLKKGKNRRNGGGIVIPKPEKRVKERPIQFVREKVQMWRQMHRGSDKKNLDVAADILGLSRKTLDDYYLQIRRAENYGFDFESHRNDKMGVLRKFVKLKMEHEKQTNSNQKPIKQEKDSLNNNDSVNLRSSIKIEEHIEGSTTNNGQQSGSYTSQQMAHQQQQQEINKQQQQQVLPRLNVGSNGFNNLNNLAESQNFLPGMMNNSTSLFPTSNPALNSILQNNPPIINNFTIISNLPSNFINPQNCSNQAESQIAMQLHNYYQQSLFVGMDNNSNGNIPQKEPNISKFLANSDQIDPVNNNLSERL